VEGRSKAEESSEKFSVLHKRKRQISGRTNRGYVVDYRIDCKSLHQPLELFGRKRTEFLGIPGPDEMTAFNTFVQEKVTIAFPQQTLYL